MAGLKIELPAEASIKEVLAVGAVVERNWCPPRVDVESLPGL